MAGRGEGAGVRDRPAGCPTDREVGVVAPVLVAGSEKAAAHRLGLSRSTVKHHLANARSKVGWLLSPGSVRKMAQNERGTPPSALRVGGRAHPLSGRQQGRLYAAAHL